MSLRSTLPLLLLLAACDGGGSKDTDTAGGADDTRGFDYFVFTNDAYTGDTVCVGGELPAVDPAKQVNVTYNGEVHDFQTENEVSEATVRFWLGDDISGSPDDEQTADADGNFTTTVPTCTPIAYGTFTPPEWEETVDTYEVHQVYGFEESGTVDGEWVNSVSQSTSKIIPSVIGIEWDSSTGIIAGTAFDCNEAEIGNAQIFIHDAAGAAPVTGEIFFFDDNNLPTSHDELTATNPENGLWVAVNVPVGTWTAEMWGWSGTEHVLLGSTVLNILAGSVNISNIYAGHDDGIAYPASCLADAI
jgi:hypothetical protein